MINISVHVYISRIINLFLLLKESGNVNTRKTIQKDDQNIQKS